MKTQFISLIAVAAFLGGCITSPEPPNLAAAASQAVGLSQSGESRTELQIAIETAERLQLTQVDPTKPTIPHHELLYPKPFAREILVQFVVPDHTIHNRTGIAAAMVWPDKSRVKYTYYDTATSGDIGTGTEGSIYDSFIIPVPANHWVTLHKNGLAEFVRIQTL